MLVLHSCFTLAFDFYICQFTIAFMFMAIVYEYLNQNFSKWAKWPPWEALQKFMGP